MDLEPEPEAKVIPNGEAITGDTQLFSGSLRGARAFIAGLTAEQRADVSIWTSGHVFAPDELEAEEPGHEHD